jgi:hypothetical protein
MMSARALHFLPESCAGYQSKANKHSTVHRSDDALLFFTGLAANIFPATSVPAVPSVRCQLFRQNEFQKLPHWQIPLVAVICDSTWRRMMLW